MKKYQLSIKITLFLLTISIVPGSTPVSRVKIHGGFVPTLSFAGGFQDRSYVLGASYSHKKMPYE